MDLHVVPPLTGSATWNTSHYVADSLSASTHVVAVSTDLPWLKHTPIL